MESYDFYIVFFKAWNNVSIIRNIQRGEKVSEIINAMRISGENVNQILIILQTLRAI